MRWWFFNNSKQKIFQGKWKNQLIFYENDIWVYTSFWTYLCFQGILEEGFENLKENYVLSIYKKMKFTDPNISWYLIL